jgi:aspartyl-tRNA(Asn)/glutamyl-tRNA(Gln) amidotransferase subunit C
MPTTLRKAPCIIASASPGGDFAGFGSADKSMSLDKDQVQHIAVLARLRVADDEIADTVDKLSRIVDFVDQLSQADTADVVPMAHPLDAAQRLRADVVTEPDERDEIQKNAPAVSGGLYLVPKVIE